MRHVAKTLNTGTWPFDVTVAREYVGSRQHARCPYLVERLAQRAGSR